VLESDLAYGQIDSVGDVPRGLIDRLEHYFLSYKQFPRQAQEVEIVDVYDRVEALDVISGLRDYQTEFPVRNDSIWERRRRLPLGNKGGTHGACGNRSL
jgi:inorganic pyrophosphatase